MRNPTATSAVPTGALLQALCRDLAERVDAAAVMVSRLVGDLLVTLVERSPTRRTLQIGLGFLVSDYPLTAEVLRAGRPCRVSLADPGADASEAELLRQLGYDRLLMVPLLVGGASWGLVEAYRVGQDFTAGDEAAAVELVAAAARSL